MSTMGDRIRNRRLEIGLSVDEIARRLGKNRATVYRYESDEIENFPFTVIEPLADVLQVSPAYLMGWTDDKSADLDLSSARAREIISGLPAGEGREAALNAALIDLLVQLTPEEAEKVGVFVQGLIAARAKPSAPPA